jgi:hypothetical protein
VSEDDASSLVNLRAFIDGADAPVEPPNDPVQVAAGVELPPGCPIIPIGKDGAIRYFLDGNRQLRAIEGARLTRLQILDLFGTGAAHAEKIFGTETNRGKLRFNCAGAEQALLAASAAHL